MRNQFLCAAGLLAAVAAGPAAAADLAVKAPYYKAPPPVSTWTGFYIGANGGIATGTQSGTVSDNQNPPTTGSLSNRIGGGYGGVTAGYNWEINRTVLGLETDFQYGSITGSNTLPGSNLSRLTSPYYASNGIYDKTINSKLDWFGTVRGRVGYDVGSWLPYVTGGFAYAHTNTSESETCTGPTNMSPGCGTPAIPWGGGSNSEVRLGWVAGAGVEYAINQNWSFKAEYLHMGFGSQNEAMAGTAGNPGAAWGTFPNKDSYTNTLGIDTVRAGINYRF